MGNIAMKCKDRSIKMRNIILVSTAFLLVLGCIICVVFKSGTVRALSAKRTNQVSTFPGAPLNILSADFNEDGYEDLVAGFGRSGRGIIRLYTGTGTVNNADLNGKSIDLLSSGLVESVHQDFDLLVEPQFMGVGDYNNDGHQDVIAAMRHRPEMVLIPGNGAGGFGNPVTQVLGGNVVPFAFAPNSTRDKEFYFSVRVDTVQNDCLNLHSRWTNSARFTNPVKV